jgi:hypothetical protein
MTLLLYVAALFEGGELLLAGAGQSLAMGGSPLYVAAGAVLAIGYAVAAGATVRGRRWGRRTLVSAEWVRLAGFAASLLAGLLPWVDSTVTVAGLLDGVALPIAVIVLARRVLPPAPKTKRGAPVAVEPAPTVTMPVEVYR